MAHLPKGRTAQKQEKIFQSGMLGSASSIPFLNTLSAWDRNTLTVSGLNPFTANVLRNAPYNTSCITAALATSQGDMIFHVIRGIDAKSVS